MPAPIPMPKKRPMRAADIEKKSNGWPILISNLYLMTFVALIMFYLVGQELKMGGQLAINCLNYYFLGFVIERN